MVTLLLQWASTFALLAFALLALGVARESRGAPRPHRAAWLLTGTAFLLAEVNATVQGVFGTWAFVEGEGSRVWDSYLLWYRSFNHSRTLMLIAFAGTLGWLIARRGRLSGRFWAGCAAAWLAGMAAGGLLGVWEGGSSSFFHYAVVARWDLIELIALLAVLVAALATARMDRLLWLALVVYAVHLALNVVSMAAISAMRLPEEWAPSIREMMALRAVLTLATAGIAGWRLVLARRETVVPPLGGGESEVLRLTR